MNLDDLILITQISELKRLQIGCIKARDAIQKTKNQRLELEKRAKHVLAEFKSKQDAALRHQIEQIEAEVQRLTDESANSRALQSQSSREERFAQINALNVRLREDIAECQQKLQTALSELQNTDGHQNQASRDVSSDHFLQPIPGETSAEISDTRKTVSIQEEVIPKADDIEPARLPESPAQETNVCTQTTRPADIEARLADLETKVRESIQQKLGPKSKAFALLPKAKLDWKPNESDTETIAEHINRASLAAENLETIKAARWGQGVFLLLAGLVVFFAVTIATALVKVDVGSLLAFDISQLDLTWIGISSLAGFVISILAGIGLRRFASRDIRKTVSEMLLHTSNAKAAAEYFQTNKETERAMDTETSDNAELAEADAETDLTSVPETSDSAEIPVQPFIAVADQDDVAVEPRGPSHNERIAELQAACSESINALISQHTEQIRREVESLETSAVETTKASMKPDASIEEWRTQESAKIQKQHAAVLQQAQKKLVHELNEKYEQLDSEAKSALARWNANITIASELARISRERATNTPDWIQLMTEDWTIPASLPGTVNVGSVRAVFPTAPDTITEELSSTLSIELPGLLNCPDNLSMAIYHDDTGRNTALEFARAITLRLLTQIPRDQIQFTLIDPVGSDQSFSELSKLAEHHTHGVDSDTGSDPTKIEEKLQCVCDRMQGVQNAFLASGAITLVDHNARSPNPPVPYQLVVITGFPKNFSDAAAHSLKSLLADGARCGIHFLIMWSPDKSIPSSFETESLKEYCTEFYVRNGAIRVGDPGAQNEENSADVDFMFVAAPAPTIEQSVSIISRIGEQWSQGIHLADANFQQASSSEVVAADAESTTEGNTESTEVELTTPTADVTESEQTVESEVPATAVPTDRSTEQPTDNSADGESNEAQFEPQSENPDSQTGNTIETNVFPEPQETEEQIESENIHSSTSEDIQPNQDSVGETVATVPATLHESIAASNNTESSDSAIADPSIAIPRIDQCRPLTAQMEDDGTEPGSNSEPRVWIGASGDGNEYASFHFQRSRGQNVLLVGQNDKVADAILASTIVSLCAGRSSGTARTTAAVLLHDGQDGDALQKFTSSFPQEVASRLTIHAGSDVESILAQLLQELEKRERAEASNSASELVFIVREIGRFQSLRRNSAHSDNPSLNSSTITNSPSGFAELLRKGPRVGIHVIVWVETYEMALECLSNSLLREFDLRIALAMNSEASNHLIGRTDAENLDSESAILYSEQSRTIRRFQPFGWPPGEWLATLPQAAEPDFAQSNNSEPGESAASTTEVAIAEQDDDDDFTVADDVMVVPLTEKQSEESSTANSQARVEPIEETRSRENPPEKKLSGMALRMSTRNIDPLRPLDAPPEPKPEIVNPDQPVPDSDFDEMDFNSLLIE